MIQLLAPLKTAEPQVHVFSGSSMFTNIMVLQRSKYAVYAFYSTIGLLMLLML
jgi:hypothetical protein